MRTLSPRLVLVGVILGTVALLGGSCDGVANEAPIILSLSSEPTSVVPGGSATITCFATDPDDDSLSYSWESSDGSISGSGKVITWTAPDDTGTYPISITVTDGKGGVANRSYAITVVPEAANKPPVITSLSIEPMYVEPQKKATVTCVANDPNGDPLTYRWWTSLGRFEGAGSTVTWVAPIHTGEYEIEG